MIQQEKIDLLNLVKRMRSRCDNMRMEFKQSGHHRKHDMDAMLEQINTIERIVGRVPVNA